MWRYYSVKRQKLESSTIKILDCRRAVQATVSGIIVLLCLTYQQSNQNSFLLSKVVAACSDRRNPRSLQDQEQVLKKNVDETLFTIPVIVKTARTEWQSEAGWVKHKGLYRNHVYGFSVEIPKGKTGVSPPPPNPQHGVKVNLSEKSESYLWAAANYDSSELGSLDKIANKQLDFLKEKNTDVKEMGRKAILVNKNKAIRLIIQYKDSQLNQVMIREIIFVLKAPRNKGSNTGTIYELGLVTAQAQYQHDEKLLVGMKRTWKM